jgi:hypothetical protein
MFENNPWNQAFTFIKGVLSVAELSNAKHA